MKTLVAFDVDGTLYSGHGPISSDQVLRLRSDPAMIVAIVSPSPARPNDGTEICLHGDGSDRVANLRALLEKHTDAQLRIYVSDNKDIGKAVQAGFCYIEAVNFAAGVCR